MCTPYQMQKVNILLSITEQTTIRGLYFSPFKECRRKICRGKIEVENSTAIKKCWPVETKYNTLTRSFYDLTTFDFFPNFVFKIFLFYVLTILSTSRQRDFRNTLNANKSGLMLMTSLSICSSYLFSLFVYMFIKCCKRL